MGVLLLGLGSACGARTDLSSFFHEAGGPADGASGSGGASEGSGGVGGGPTSAACPAGTLDMGAPECARLVGSGDADEIHDVAVDAAGNVYVAGSTLGALAAPNAGGTDAFVQKVDAAGELVWVRQLGTADAERAFRLALGSGGQVFVLIATESGMPLQTTTRIVELDADGNEVSEAATDGLAADLVVDSFGDLIVATTIHAGSTELDAAVYKLSAGSTVWSNAFVTVQNDVPAALAALPDGGVLVGGVTDGALFAESAGAGDAFVAQLASYGGALWGLQFGGQGSESVRGLAVDSQGNAYAVGSTDEPTAPAPTVGFVAEVDSTGGLAWFRIEGEPRTNGFWDVAADAADQVTATGTTVDPLGDQDALARRIARQADLGAGLQFGTAGVDSAVGIAVAPDGALFVAGTTQGPDGGPDGYVQRVAF